MAGPSREGTVPANHDSLPLAGAPSRDLEVRADFLRGGQVESVGEGSVKQNPSF